MNANDTSRMQAQLRVIGHNVMHNQLLVSFLEQETGLPCRQYPRLDLPITDSTDESTSILFLLDSKGINLNEIWDNLGERVTPRYAQLIFTIYNLEPDTDIGMEAVERGIRGIFFNNQPLHIIPKGVKAILGGELWYPRKILSKCIMTLKRHKHIPVDGNVILTKREREILLRVFAGESNQDIAEDLCISYHTVKTHIYNIYKKINTQDRFQATLWAAKHL